jgi:hypothetical protein
MGMEVSEVADVVASSVATTVENMVGNMVGNMNADSTGRICQEYLKVNYVRMKIQMSVRV